MKDPSTPQMHYYYKTSMHFFQQLFWAGEPYVAVFAFSQFLSSVS